jgi:glycosyltransferase involved in cell wall biosynthesis
MKVSVAIPTYNSSATIRMTLESVVQQTLTPHEILIVDDGSTDDTVSTVNRFTPQVTVFEQKNQGVAGARNALCRLATGDLIAFLDHDDLWHPQYLERQCRAFDSYPDSAAFFTGHTDFCGYGEYIWDRPAFDEKSNLQIISPIAFFERYNSATGPFGSMSYCCVPKRTLGEIGDAPFHLSGVDDSYFCSKLPLLGRPIVYEPAPLVAYRVTANAQSTDKLKALGLWVEVFEQLEISYLNISSSKLRKSFASAFASKRRSYGKILMGSGKISQARTQLRRSLEASSDPVSRAKSTALFLSTYLPTHLQPSWPKSSRPTEALTT